MGVMGDFPVSQYSSDGEGGYLFISFKVGFNTRWGVMWGSHARIEIRAQQVKNYLAPNEGASDGERSTM